MNVESIAEVKVLTSAIRLNTDARAACRSRRPPRAGPTSSGARSTTSSATPAGTPTARPTSSTAIRKRSSTSATGAFDWRPRRQAGRQQQAVLLLHARNSHRARRATTSRASACRPRSSVRATSRRPATTSATLPVHQGSASHRNVFGDESGRVLRGRRRPRAGFPRAGSIRPGLNILKMYPLPNRRRAGRGVQLRNHAADGIRARLAARAPPRLPAAGDAPRHLQVLGLGHAEPDVQWIASRLQRRAPAEPQGRRTYRDHDQSRDQPDDLRRGHLRTQPERARGLRARSGRHGTDVLHERLSDERRTPTATRPVLASADALPGRAHDQPGLLRGAGARHGEPAHLAGRHAGQVPPNFTWGGRVANSPPNTPYPGFLNINSTNDVSISLTTVRGSHTVKTGFYNTHSYKAQNQGNPFGTITFTNDSQQSARLAVPLLERGPGHLRLLPAAVGLRRRQLRLQQHRGLHSGQLAREHQTHTRLRTAARAPAAAVRRARAGVELLPRPVVARGRRRCSTSPAARTARRPARARTGRRRIRSPASSSAPTRPSRSARSSPTRATARTA